jgi:hypothetical protein
MLRLTAITLLVWWPRRAANYEYLGLKVDLFLEEMWTMRRERSGRSGCFFRSGLCYALRE